MYVFPTLYKIDTQGKVRQWRISVGNNGDNYYEQEYGIKDGALQTTRTYVYEGKNLGKANETSPEEQCLAEAASLWRKKQNRKGYTETLPDSKSFGPMLTKNYHKDGKHILFPCYVQPKLDGIRCIAVVDKDGLITLVSRQNSQFTILEHIEFHLRDFPAGIYDGELYVHGESFQKIISAVKRDKPNEYTDKIEYHIYDIVDDRLSFVDRLNKIHSLQWSDKIKMVETHKCDNHEEVACKFSEWTKAGYEGLILRNSHGKYKVGGRSKDLQKMKDFQDMEFVIIGAEENKGKLAGTCVFWLKTQDGGEFKAMPEGSQEEREQLWKDWQDNIIQVGDVATVKFFEWTDTVPPVPRFPIFKGLL